MKQYVIIAGAGISVDPPANLPSWWKYNQKLINQIKTEALKLCPEASDMLACIDAEKKLPVQCISELVASQGAGESYFPLLELLNGTNPNANHFALVELARQGKLKTVVTTNFDTLIETAFRKEAVPLFTVIHKQEYYEATGTVACKLIKIHGSVHDDKTLIDTVSQKAKGLSSEKKYLLEGAFADSEILVIGFSGADLDFDLNYIPLMQALEEGSTLTWIVRPNCTPNPNVTALQEKYPDKVFVKEAELSELFRSMGVDYEKIQNTLKREKPSNSEEILDQRIEELFSSAHIGAHGCVGYCLSMLEMMGESKAASDLARLYEKKLDWSALSVSSVLGINALARQKLLERNFAGSAQCYEAVIQCHQQLNDLNNALQQEKQILLSSEQKRKQEMETAQNMAAAYLNLGVVYYYMAVQEQADTLKKAEEILEKAQSIIQSEPTIPMHSLVLFNLGRVKYKASRDYDRYLNTLRISRDYAKKEGRLDTLAEILHAECAVRMMIGEYYLAKQALIVSHGVLKNVGRTALNKQWELLDQQYRQRTGDIDQKFAGLYIQELEKKVDNPVRKMIISFEVQRGKIIIPELFSKLCRDYLEKEDWLRLEDVALCYLDAVDTDLQRSDAWYLLGCAMTEQASCAAAEGYFTQIVSLGDRADQMKLGWAHAELSRLQSQQGDGRQAVYHFGECLRILDEQGHKKELAPAGISCIRSLFQNKFFENGESCAAQLLTVIDKVDAEDVEKYLDHLRAMYRPVVCKDVQDKSPQVLATEANELHRIGDRKLAWERMALAKEKYLECADKEGVGRCENNMGNWCLAEGDRKHAIEHFQTALEIKHTLGDKGGVANQLAILLHLFLLEEDFENAGKFAGYAEANMPTFLHVQERYVLYSSMFDYFFKIGEYASALAYGEKAEEGLKYLEDVSQVDAKRLSEAVGLLKSMFEQQPILKNPAKYEKQLQEAIRLYKSGRLDESLAAIDQLRDQYGEDLLKKSEIEGTRANAYLHNKKYSDAINHFEQTICILEEVDGARRELAQDHLVTAINGMAVALGYLGKNEEALDLFRRELKQKNLSRNSEIALTINLCNRLVLYYQDSLEKGDEIFKEVQCMLDSLSGRHHLNHEEQGTIYCSYGMLHMAADDIGTAKSYYQQAKNEFLITNSQRVEQVEQALKMLEDE